MRESEGERGKEKNREGHKERERKRGTKKDVESGSVPELSYMVCCHSRLKAAQGLPLCHASV